MTNPHPRPVLVLTLLAALFLPVAGLAFCPDLWDAAGSCACAVGDELGALVDSDVKKVARRALKTCQAFADVQEQAQAREARPYFKAFRKAAKRLRKTVRRAERRGIDVKGIRGSADALRIATRKMVEDGIDTLKARPDFETNDHVVRAAAQAEACLEAAREALEGRKPLIGSLTEYRRAYLVLADFL